MKIDGYVLAALFNPMWSIHDAEDGKFVIRAACRGCVGESNDIIDINQENTSHIVRDLESCKRQALANLLDEWRKP